MISGNLLTDTELDDITNLVIFANILGNWNERLWTSLQTNSAC